MAKAVMFRDVTGRPPTAKYAEVLKVDDSLGLVLGWAIVCKKDGADYFDLQDDHIPEQSMLRAAAEFMQNSRVAKEMHEGVSAGTVVFAFPMTTDIAKAFGVETKTTGLMIGLKPDNDAMLTKFKSGELTGFSIGGFRIEDEGVE
jgi:Putative phage serine protease XkdF